jgi:hypothetical protein
MWMRSRDGSDIKKKNQRAKMERRALYTALSYLHLYVSRDVVFVYEWSCQDLNFLRLISASFNDDWMSRQLDQSCSSEPPRVKAAPMIFDCLIHQFTLLAHQLSIYCLFWPMPHCRTGRKFHAAK